MTVVDLFSLGRHVMLLHDSEAQRTGNLGGWVLGGLRRRDRVFCPPGSREHDVEDLLSVLAGGDRNLRRSLEAAVAEGRLLMPTAGDYYGRGRLEAMRAQALADGFIGVRFIGEAVTALSLLGPGGCLEFEADLDVVCEDGRAAAICFYDQRVVPHGLTLDHVPVHAGGLQGNMFALADAGGALRLDGELDASNAELLQEVLTAASDRQAPGSRLRLQIGEDAFFDIAAARAILLGTSAFRDDGGRVRLRIASAPVRQLFALLGMEHFPGMVVHGGTDL
jgi:anti-anti-sigma factor